MGRERVESSTARLEPIVGRYREKLFRDAEAFGARDAGLALDHETPSPTPSEWELWTTFHAGAGEIDDALTDWQAELVTRRSHAQQLIASFEKGEPLPKPPRQVRVRIWPWEWVVLVLVLTVEMLALVDPVAALFNLEEGSTKPFLFSFVVVLAAGGLAELHAWWRQRADEERTSAQRRTNRLAAWLTLVPVLGLGVLAVAARAYMVQLGAFGAADGMEAIAQEAFPLLAFAFFQAAVTGAAIGLPRVFHRRLREAQRQSLVNWRNTLRAELDVIASQLEQMNTVRADQYEVLERFLLMAIARYRSQLAALHPDVRGRVEWANRNARELDELDEKVPGLRLFNSPLRETQRRGLTGHG